jgi:hypothetical protein
VSKRYIVTIDTNDLKHATDMLRFDGCYEAVPTPSGWCLKLLTFTPARWASFGVSYARLMVTEHKVTASEATRQADKALGFREALKAVPQLLKDRDPKGYVADGFRDLVEFTYRRS